MIADHVGGGFGSKASLGMETIAAIELARAAKAPVRVAFDRHEELSVTGYRPAAEVKIALLPSAQGDLKALSLTAYADTGAAINSTLAALARLIYPAEAKELADFDVISNLPPGAPFRGPGGPPMAFALEQAIDEAALRMKVDPIALRKRWDPNPNRQRLYDWAAGLDVWRNRKTPPRRPAAIAAASASPPDTGFISGSPARRSNWRSRADASSRARRCRTSAPAAAPSSPTRSRTNSGWSRMRSRCGSAIPICRKGRASGGSRVTASVDPADAARRAKTQGRDRAQREAAAGRRARTRRGANCSPPRPISPSPACGRRTASRPRRASVRRCKEAGFMGIIFGWMMRRFSNLAVGAGVPSSVQVIEVEVDTWLGHVRVLNVHTGIAVGKIAAPALARSQAAGSVIQGIGYALYEARETDSRSGDMLTAGMEDYRIPGIADTPADRRAFRRRRFRSCAGRQRRHRRGRDRSDLAGDRQRHLQRDRHQADRESRSGPTA